MTGHHAAHLLLLADRASGHADPLNQCQAEEGGWGRSHPHLKGASVDRAGRGAAPQIARAGRDRADRRRSRYLADLRARLGDVAGLAAPYAGGRGLCLLLLVALLLLMPCEEWKRSGDVAKTERETPTKKTSEHRCEFALCMTSRTTQEASP